MFTISKLQELEELQEKLVYYSMDLEEPVYELLPELSSILLEKIEEYAENPACKPENLLEDFQVVNDFIQELNTKPEENHVNCHAARSFVREALKLDSPNKAELKPLVRHLITLIRIGTGWFTPETLMEYYMDYEEYTENLNYAMSQNESKPNKYNQARLAELETCMYTESINEDLLESLDQVSDSLRGIQDFFNIEP